MSGGRYYISFPDGQRCQVRRLQDVVSELERWIHEHGPQHNYKEFAACRWKRGQGHTPRVYYDIVDGHVKRKNPQPQNPTW